MAGWTLLGHNTDKTSGVISFGFWAPGFNPASWQDDGDWFIAIRTLTPFALAGTTGPSVLPALPGNIPCKWILRKEEQAVGQDADHCLVFRDPVLAFYVHDLHERWSQWDKKLDPQQKYNCVLDVLDFLITQRKPKFHVDAGDVDVYSSEATGVKLRNIIRPDSAQPTDAMQKELVRLTRNYQRWCNRYGK